MLNIVDPITHKIDFSLEFNNMPTTYNQINNNEHPTLLNCNANTTMQSKRPSSYLQTLRYKNGYNIIKKSTQPVLSPPRNKLKVPTCNLFPNFLKFKNGELEKIVRKRRKMSGYGILAGKSLF